MTAWILYGVGIAGAFAAGWLLRGLRDADRANKAALAKDEHARWAAKKFVKLGKD
jgi:hypothetical protein